MTKHSEPPLKRFLRMEGISQADYARGVKKTTAFISLLVNEETSPSQDTINDSLKFFAKRCGRPVTYEESFLGASTRQKASA